MEQVASDIETQVGDEAEVEVDLEVEGESEGGGNRGGRHGSFTPNDNSFIANIPHDIDINGSLSFPDDKWKNFTPQQKTAIQALRRHKQQCRQVAVIHSDLINQRSTSTNPSQELVTLPPVPTEIATPRPEANSTSSSQAGQAFGRSRA